MNEKASIIPSGLTVAQKLERTRRACIETFHWQPCAQCLSMYRCASSQKCEEGHDCRC